MPTGPLVVHHPRSACPARAMRFYIALVMFTSLGLARPQGPSARTRSLLSYLSQPHTLSLSRSLALSLSLSVIPFMCGFWHLVIFSSMFFKRPLSACAPFLLALTQKHAARRFCLPFRSSLRRAVRVALRMVFGFAPLLRSSAFAACCERKRVCVCFY